MLGIVREIHFHVFKAGLLYAEEDVGNGVKLFDISGFSYLLTLG